MADIVTPEKRSEIMSGIRGKNTKPEMIIRKGLHRRGFRYRLHATDLPGKPDLVFPKYRAIILVHGCFWHGHGCQLFKWPKTRKSFWSSKIKSNRSRDAKCIESLQSAGWKVAVVWECAVKGRKKIEQGNLLNRLHNFLESDSALLEIEGI